MRSIIIGVLFLIGGLSGGLVLRGTGSSGALALVGAAQTQELVINTARRLHADHRRNQQAAGA